MQIKKLQNFGCYKAISVLYKFSVGWLTEQNAQSMVGCAFSKSEMLAMTDTEVYNTDSHDDLLAISIEATRCYAQFA